ncbi:hypothetical protein Ahy_A08g038962 [Arachis hypogaea]|uniref:Protein FAR1-RELATED SEQUENCE n=1 Tax=Arachis hypogaea TaxID=3818 RepID=A0A445BV91_ARAHY|nr:hypothetical protein Ahy_A08g038962 [Arachis hypogaea]
MVTVHQKPNTPTLSHNPIPNKPSPNVSRTIVQNFQSLGHCRAQSAVTVSSPRSQLDAPTASWKIDATCVHGGVAKPLCQASYGIAYDVSEYSNFPDVNVPCLSEDDTPLVEEGKEFEDAIQKKDDATISNNEFPDHTGIPMEEIPYWVQEFYSNYAKKFGFVTRIRNTNFDKTRKELKVPINQSLHCSREGYRESRVKAAMRVKRITTAGCKARMYVMLDRQNDNWLVSKLELKHTHTCSAEQAVHYSEYRELTMHANCVIKNHDEAGIWPNKTYLALANEVGGSSKLGYSEEDVWNYITRNLRCADTFMTIVECGFQYIFKVNSGLFVHEYDNVLGNKEQKELEDDAADSKGVIPCSSSSTIERQFQSEYTTSKFREVQHEFIRGVIQEGDLFRVTVNEQYLLYEEPKSWKYSTQYHLAMLSLDRARMYSENTLSSRAAMTRSDRTKATTYLDDCVHTSTMLPTIL